MPFIADRRLYLTADRSEVVEEGDSRAAFLLAGVGGRVPDAEAKRLGLVSRETPETKELEPAETKVIYPAETKRRTKGK